MLLSVNLVVLLLRQLLPASSAKVPPMLLFVPFSPLLNW